MAAARSAGILLYRHAAAGLEVLLVHPGGPLWAKRDAGAWSIPKGVPDDGEDARACARREFEEELGSPPPGGPLLELGTIRQKGGKVVEAFGLEGDLDATAIRSTPFTMQWPPRSGRQAQFPEVDRAAWFGIDEARGKLIGAQAELLDRLLERVAGDER
jgi:predicted NUDIX family NTP pyrophosphohydrolase